MARGNVTQHFNGAQLRMAKAKASAPTAVPTVQPQSHRESPHMAVAMAATLGAVASLDLRRNPPPPLVDLVARKAMNGLNGQGWTRSLAKGRLAWAGDSLVNRAIVKLIYPMFPNATSSELTILSSALKSNKVFRSVGRYFDIVPACITDTHRCGDFFEAYLMAASQGPGCKAIVKQWIRDVFSHLAIACHAAVKAAMYGHASQAQGAAGAFAEIRANGGGWPSQPSTSGGFPVASQSQQYRPLGGIYSSQATQARQLEAHPGRFIAGRRTVTASGLSTRETAPKKIALATYTGSVNEISATASVKQPAVIDLTEDSDDDRDAVTWPSGHAKTPSAASLQHAHSMMSAPAASSSGGRRMRSRSNIRPAKPPAAASTGAVIDLTEDSDNTDDNELDEIEDDLMVFD